MAGEAGLRRTLDDLVDLEALQMTRRSGRVKAQEDTLGALNRRLSIILERQRDSRLALSAFCL